jgi:hypothetical protein
MIINYPEQGFLGLLEGRQDFVSCLNSSCAQLLEKYGLNATIDEDRAKASFVAWQVSTLSLAQRRKVERSEVENADFRIASGLKMAGACLWSLSNKSCAPFVTFLETKAQVFGGAPGSHDPHLKSLFVDYPMQMGAFNFVYWVYNAEQAGRLRDKQAILRPGASLHRPPNGSHYLTNLCKYLQLDSPRPMDLYMLFKTMDWFTFEEPKKIGTK